MLVHKRGYIVNVCSMAGEHGVPMEAINSASKHGMIGFADALAQEVAGLIEFILSQPTHTLYKRVSLFPVSEWH
ncbi:MAG: SDR family NAD(P)-dependent oxidoreductase [Anaerolineaceae bacterium]|nr:SDR family NAD(P)-dependent oxidoreductase [Anaerolineaceae bacterium]